MTSAPRTCSARSVSRSLQPRPLSRVIGPPLLVLSGLGFPMSQLAIRRLGRSGAIIVEGVTTALAARDTYLVVSGVPDRLRLVPAGLLYAELAMAAVASVLGLRVLIDHETLQAAPRPAGVQELLRRVALGTLFGLHTWRFAIYLGAHRGMRQTPEQASAD